MTDQTPANVPPIGDWNRLLDGRVDVGIAVVLEHPEEPVEPHVDARRLDHRRVERVDPHPSGVDLGPDVLV